MQMSNQNLLEDECLELFRRQYFQLLPPEQIVFPPDNILKEPAFQVALMGKVFGNESHVYHPSNRYRLRILKAIIGKIEASFQDPDEDEILDDLMSCFTSLITSRLPPESILAQQKSYVTYFLPLPLSFHEKSSEITLAESRALISSSGSTGLRTWDAALHLGSYLVSALGRRLIEGKNVLELGAGTGFLSILCAKHLGARRVLATDGDSRVLEDIRVNAFLNGIEEESNLDAKPLNWGQELSILDKHKSADSQQWQIVLGADVTYDVSAIFLLVSTFQNIFTRYPTIKIVVAATIRNEETFNVFINACNANSLLVEYIPFDLLPIESQLGFFYGTRTPIKILSVKGQIFDEDPFAI